MEANGYRCAVFETGGGGEGVTAGEAAAGGVYSGPGTNPAGRMVGTVGRPDNHNWTGRFNEPYARYSTHLPSDGHLIIRDTRTLGHLPPPRTLVRFSLLPPFSRLETLVSFILPRSDHPRGRPLKGYSGDRPSNPLASRSLTTPTTRPNVPTLVPRACFYIKPLGWPGDNKDI